MFRSLSFHEGVRGLYEHTSFHGQPVSSWSPVDMVSTFYFTLGGFVDNVVS